MTRYIMQFSKTGTSCYISHLDLVRVFFIGHLSGRVSNWNILRDSIRILKTGFAQPLSLGYPGIREYIEFETKEEHAARRSGRDVESTDAGRDRYASVVSSWNILKRRWRR